MLELFESVSQDAVESPRDDVSDIRKDAMATLSLSLKHVPLDREEACAVCKARFTPSEDSGSRVLSMVGVADQPLRIMMCGGCHSKWSHGTTVNVAYGAAR